jgi:hypothetical protein
MTWVNVAIAILLTAGGVRAQPMPIAAQENALAQQLLHSPRLADKAWGAYLAGRLRPDDLQGMLVEQFQSAASMSGAASGSEEYGFVAVLFDAAIEADVSLPAAVLEPFEERWQDPVLILLVHAKDSEEFLLRLGENKVRDLVWLAANNRLAEMRSQRWYVRTLSEISITHRFTLVDPNSGSGHGGVGGGFCGDGIYSVPKGFPPITLYTLQNQPMRRSVLLVPGPKDVFYQRTMVPTDKHAGFGSCGSILNRPDIQAGYLAQLAGMPIKKGESLLHSETEISNSGVENFKREVEQALEEQEKGIRGMILAIKKRELDAGPGVRLQIISEVNDQRHNPTYSVPAVAPREFVLE